MAEKKDIRKYKTDEFKINCFYNEKGKPIFQIIEEAFKSYYNLKINT